MFSMPGERAANRVPPRVFQFSTPLLRRPFVKSLSAFSGVVLRSVADGTGTSSFPHVHTEQHGGIQITKLGNFYKKCVEWAAEEFQWPGYEPAELYAVNKVLNEPDFPHSS